MFKLFEAFKHGKKLAHAAGWKDVQLATTGLTVILNVLLYILKMFVELPEISSENVAIVSGGLAAIVNVALTYLTTDKALLFQDGNQPMANITKP